MFLTNKRVKICNWILKNINLELKLGDSLCILGPNGVGKTTLFKTILGLLDKIGGSIDIDGRDMGSISRKELAKLIAYVPQAHVPPFPFKVLDVVSMGRTPHMSNFGGQNKEDAKISEEAIDLVGISYLKDEIYTEISGGERQMVLIARALAQQSQFLVMDEPTSNLDFGNQVKIMKIVKGLSENGKGIIMTSHFPDHTFIASNKVLAIGRDGYYKIGTPDEVVTSETLGDLYDIEAKVEDVYEGSVRIAKVCVPSI